MAPATMQASDAIVALDLLAASRTLASCVALHPVMKHSLGRPRRLDIGGNARGRGSLNAPFMYRVFANCKEIISHIVCLD